jgi:subtilisin family serine protease
MNHVCHFQDYLMRLTRSEKAGVLADAGVGEVVWPESEFSPPPRDNHITDRAAYRDLVRELRALFGRDGSVALEALLGVDGELTWATQIPDRARELLTHLRDAERDGESIERWATHPDNWCLVYTDQPAYSLQSRVSALFPCLVFDDGPLEVSGDVSAVSLSGVEDILRNLGVYHIWKRGNYGQGGPVVVVDTGYAPLNAADTVQLRAVARMDPLDTDGHGTAMIHLMRAISPSAPITSLRVMETHSGGRIWDLVSALTQLHTVSGHIVSIALGVPPSWVAGLGPSAASFRESIANIIDGIGRANNFPVCAAGNDGHAQLRWPAAATQCLAVGSHNGSYTRSTFSNYTNDGPNFLLTTGGEIRRNDDRVEAMGRYGPGQTRDIVGTSFSSAAACGFASLLQGYSWFARMNVESRISLLRSQCRRNSEGFALLNAADIGALWPL